MTEEGDKKNPKKRKLIENPLDKEETKENNMENEVPFSFYSLLNIEKTASIEEIKKAYKALALKFHPDKNRDSPEEARKNFQKVTDAYKILIDVEKRKMYDETGTIDSGNLDDFMDAYKYFRSIYRKIEKEDIEDFSKKYRFSELEKEDLMNFFKDHKGNVTLLLETIPLSRNEDVERYLKFYDEMIKENKLTEFKQYSISRKKIKKLKDENDEWVEENSKNEQFENLVKQIAIKNKPNFESFFDSLESKYTKRGKQKKDMKELEINDEDFEEIQKNLDKNKKTNLKRKKKKI